MNHHIIKIHKINEDGPIPLKPNKPNKDPTAFFSGQQYNNEKANEFDLATFQAKLYAWVIYDNISFRKLDSERLNDVFEYLQPRATRFLPCHQTASSTVDLLRDKVIGEVTEELRATPSHINFSFDL